MRFVYDTTDSLGMLRTTDRWMDRHYRYNNQGLRDEVDYETGPTPPGVRRVTFVGDSFTAGHGVPDVGRRFANRVRSARPAWQIHVLAKNGLETGTETELLRQAFTAHGYRADIVVLVYCMNDIEDLMPGIVDLGRRVGAGEERGVLTRNSYVFDMLRFLWITSSDSEVRGFFPSVASAYEGVPWDEQRERLRKFRRTVEAGGAKLVVVTFPLVHCVGGDYPFRAAHGRLADFWAAERVPALDLLPVFDGQAPGDLVVGAFDAHPNERAHAIAAETILPFLDRIVGR